MNIDWTQIGVSAAVVVVVLAFLYEIRLARGEFLKTMRNHLDHNTKVIEKLHNWLIGKME